jgi:hypothetical protein
MPVKGAERTLSSGRRGRWGSGASSLLCRRVPRGGAAGGGSGFGFSGGEELAGGVEGASASERRRAANGAVRGES